MAAAGRRRLASLLRAAVAAKQGNSFSLHQGHCITSPATQQSLFSSWLDSNLNSHDLPAIPCQFTLGSARFSFSNSHYRPAQFLELAPVPDLSACENPIPGSHCTSQFPAASQDIGLLCISNRNSEQRVSIKGDVSTPTGIEKTNSSKVHERFWSSHEVVNWPNAISFGRLLSGPLLGWLIMKGILQPALIGLIIAGASDWLDGYIARRQGIHSAFGTYLDPLADKVLIGCVAFTMAQGGYLPWALVALVIGRDAALIGGSLMLGVRSLKSQALDDTFKVTKGSAQIFKPIYISKVNTVFQLALVAVALLQPAFGIEDSYALVPILSSCVAFTTCASFMGYGWKLLQQRL